jgi:hypothetical protein
MYMRLLDKTALAEVIRESPTVLHEGATTAMDCLRVLEAASTDELEVKGAEGEYWQMGVQDVAAQIAWKPSSKKVGGALGEMGLTKIRFAGGYTVFWNRRQLAVIRAELEEKYGLLPGAIRQAVSHA